MDLNHTHDDHAVRVGYYLAWQCTICQRLRGHRRRPADQVLGARMSGLHGLTADTLLDLRDVPMVLAEEDMCRRFVADWQDRSFEQVLDEVTGRFGHGRRAQVILSFVWSGITFRRSLSS
jgi:chromosome condensin MukBEF complex kleisin-like MukF subunit